MPSDGSRPDSDFCDTGDTGDTGAWFGDDAFSLMMLAVKNGEVDNIDETVAFSVGAGFVCFVIKKKFAGLKRDLSADLMLHCCGSLPENGFLQGFYEGMNARVPGGIM